MFSPRVKKRSWVWIQMKDLLRIILHFIAFCIAFYCQLDLQWENYTMLVFLFYYASVFDFPKYKKLYITSCHGRECFLPWSIKTSLQKWTKLIWSWCRPNFPMFWYTCQLEQPSNNQQLKLNWNGEKKGRLCTNITIAQPQKIVSTADKAEKAQNAGTTGEKWNAKMRRI